MSAIFSFVNEYLVCLRTRASIVLAKQPTVTKWVGLMQDAGGNALTPCTTSANHW
ncbi:MAG: hypothetical protein ACOYB1_12080 [Limnohabitans sp.]